MKIDFAKLQFQYQLYKKDIDANIQAVLDNSNYIMGDEIGRLEDELGEFTGAEKVITCSSGTDALLLAMMAVGVEPGDEVITTPFTFIATAETISLMKAVPVFVDIEKNSFNIDANKIESVITDRTKAIMPVSMFGQPADMDEINAIAKKHNLKVIVDGAQSFGATYKNEMEVHHCDIYTTSFFPAKPLGCYGDGGAVLTNDKNYAEKIKMMRVHGQNKRYHHKYIGMGGRMDTIQAAVLLAKLRHYAEEVAGRQKVAEQYSRVLNLGVKVPVIKSDRTSVWAQYTICTGNRDVMQAHLKEQDVPTAVHYPMPLHLQECFQSLNYKTGSFPVAETAATRVISLPMNPFVTLDEIKYISSVLVG